MPFAIVMSSAIALFYYLKIIKNMYFGSPSNELELYKTFTISPTIKIYTFTMLFFVIAYVFFQYTYFYKSLILF